LGLAYKENVDDMRDSPAVKLGKMLTENGAQVYFFDPFVREYPNLLKTPYDMDKIDGVILATNHKNFNSIDFKRLKKCCCRTALFFDGHGMFN
jgi:UDP-N-acetyl-D-glucosamine dehydrogenase